MASLDDNCGDGWFGPGMPTPGCRGGFDFTVLFEASILTLLPASCFVFLAPFRIVHLVKSPDAVRRNGIHVAKLVAASVLAVLQVILLSLVASKPSIDDNVSIAAAAVSFIAGVVLVLLSHLEHVKSVRPSFLVSVYLFLSLLFDCARVRTEWLLHNSAAFAGTLSASVLAKLVLLALETVEKRKFLLPQEKVLSPESTSGPFNRGFFVWLNSLLRTGYASLLTVDTLPAIYEKLSSKSLADKFESDWQRRDQKQKHALLFSALSCLRWEVMAIAVPRLALVALSISQPFIIGRAVTFLQLPDNDASRNIGYGLICAFAFVYIGSAVAQSWYEHLGFRAMAMLRGGMTALIYRKMMGLPMGNVSESGAMSLMGSDVETLAESFHMTICDTWANFIQLGLATWLLALQLGAVSVAPIIVAIASTSISFYFGRYITRRQKTWLEAIQHRINFTSEILASIKSIKMLGLTDKMTDMIENMRTTELDTSKKFRRVQSFNVCLINVPAILGQFFTFAAYAIVAKVQGSGSLSVTQAITSLSLINLLTFPLGFLLSAIPQSFSAIGCFQRIQAFLVQEPRVEKRLLGERRDKTPDSQRPGTTDASDVELVRMERTEIQPLPASSSSSTAISLEKCSFGWGASTPAAGNQVSLSIPFMPDGFLAIVVGPVGCGKSTFLKALIGETPVLEGKMMVNSSDVAFCDQSSWLINGSVRDNIVAEASFFDQDWYASVVDASALRTDLDQMPHGDRTMVGSKGVKLSGGQKQRIAIARAVYSRKRIAVFDDVFSGLDKATEQAVFEGVFGPNGLLRRFGCTAILTTHSVQRLPSADRIIALGENGKILEQGTFQQLRSSGGYVQSLEIRELTGKVSGPEAPVARVSELDRQLTQATEIPEEDNSPVGDLAVYKYYASALGWFRIGLFLVFLCGNSGFGVMTYIWLSKWASSDDSASSSRLGYWLGIYSSLGVLQALSLIISTYYVYVVVVPKASKNLHSVVLLAAMRAPMSFLSNTETGLLVNRFSQDMRLVDMVLPRAFLISGFQGVSCIAEAGLAITAVGYFAISVPFIFGVVILVQRFYLRTSRQLRLLEIGTKAPLYSHFIESLNGLVTIRAFGWAAAYGRKTLRLLDAAQRPYYLLLCIQRWLVLVLNLVVAGMAVLLMSLAVALRSHVNPGFLGVALVMMMSLGGTLTGFIQYWTLLETSLGAVARIKSFSEDTPSELLEAENGDPGKEWPQQGAVEFKDVGVKYSENSTPVLQAINITIKPGQKVGLCGRTGSGKSSLILSLLRMADLSAGQITIDGEDITSLPRPLIREKISCLTQEPFIFTSTVRLNADPLGKSADADIVAALERVGLWRVIAGKVDPDGGSGLNPLDATMDENFLSHGQRQLFCLARALLKRSRVLVLDEPTSSVDSQTDSQMQAVIESEFKHCTVIMIAHRLDSLLDFDRVAVLEKGRLIEFGEPRELLGMSGGAFSRMYRAGSSGEAFA